MAYGQPTYAPGCNGCRSRSTRNGLGFSPAPPGTMAYANTASGAAPSWKESIANQGINLAMDLGKSFLAGGGSDATSCPGQIPPSVLGTTISRATPSERAEWDRLIRGTKPAWYTNLETVPLDQLSFGIAGGGDCKVSTTAGKALVAFARQQVQKYAGVSVTASGTVPDSTVYRVDGGPTVDPIISVSGTRTDPSNDPGILDRLRDWLGDAARAGVNAARDTAVSDIYGVLPAAQQRQVQASVLDSLWSRYKVPIMLGAAVLIVPKLLPSRR